MRILAILMLASCLLMAGAGAATSIPATYKKGEIEVKGKAFLSPTDERTGGFELRFKYEPKDGSHGEVCIFTVAGEAVLEREMHGQQVSLRFFKYLLDPWRPAERFGVAAVGSWLGCYMEPVKNGDKRAAYILEIVRNKPAFPNKDPDKNSEPDSLIMDFQDFQKFQGDVDKFTAGSSGRPAGSGTSKKSATKKEESDEAVIEPRELTAVRTSWRNQVKASTEPVKKRYLQQLEALKRQLGGRGDIKGATAVQGEIDRISGDDDTAPGSVQDEKRNSTEKRKEEVAETENIQSRAEEKDAKDPFDDLKGRRKILAEDKKGDDDLSKSGKEPGKSISSAHFADVSVKDAEFKPLKKGEVIFGEYAPVWGEIPVQLKGCEFSFRHKHSGVTELSVRKKGIVLIAVSTRWGGGGNSSGGWREELKTKDDLIKDGWNEAGIIPSNVSEGPLLLLWRECKEGESFKLRTEKYLAPIVITGKGRVCIGDIAGKKPDGDIEDVKPAGEDTEGDAPDKSKIVGFWNLASGGTISSITFNENGTARHNDGSVGKWDIVNGKITVNFNNVINYMDGYMNKDGRIIFREKRSGTTVINTLILFRPRDAAK